MQNATTETIDCSCCSKAISAIRSALENNPQLYTRFLDMLASGRLQRDAEIVLFNTFLWQFHRGILAQEMPLCLKNPGGSLWLKRSAS